MLLVKIISYIFYFTLCIGVLTAAMIGTTVVLVVMIITMTLRRVLFGGEDSFPRSQSASPQQGPDEFLIGHQ